MATVLLQDNNRPLIAGAVPRLTVTTYSRLSFSNIDGVRKVASNTVFLLTAQYNRPITVPLNLVREDFFFHFTAECSGSSAAKRSWLPIIYI